MSSLKKAWITEHDAGLFALTLESENVYPEYARLTSRECVFPLRADPGETRHTMAISLLGQDDMIRLYDVIGRYFDL